ncbi:hypothetical protein SVAN01_06137 [Stagonosporopsis vannaccii]|nr:hypothetical protein SVAN01_06137 [Stagonosporopsis vannaccii]
MQEVSWQQDFLQFVPELRWSTHFGNRYTRKKVERTSQRFMHLTATPKTGCPVRSLHRSHFRGLMSQNRARNVRQHGGMGKGAREELDLLVGEELHQRTLTILTGKAEVKFINEGKQRVEGDLSAPTSGPVAGGSVKSNGNEDGDEGKSEEADKGGNGE